MALLDVFDIAGSGMSAQSMRLNLTSSNIANANTVAGNKEEAYSARHAVFSATLKDQFAPTEQGVGVEMLGVVESDAEHIMRYEPNRPMANEEGYVFVIKNERLEKRFISILGYDNINTLIVAKHPSVIEEGDMIAVTQLREAGEGVTVEIL